MPNVNHKENKLSVTTNAVFDIKLREAPYSSVLKSKDYNAFLYEVFMNYNAVSEKMLMKYLIITDPQFESGLSSFVTLEECW